MALAIGVGSSVALADSGNAGNNASNQGYGGVGVVTLPTTTPTTPSTPPAGTTPSTPAAPVGSGNAGTQTVSLAPVTAGVAGVQKTVTPASTHQATTAPRVVSGTLPFTGAQLATFALVGLALVGGGLLLRRTSRDSSGS